MCNIFSIWRFETILNIKKWKNSIYWFMWVVVLKWVSSLLSNLKSLNPSKRWLLSVFNSKGNQWYPLRKDAVCQCCPLPAFNMIFTGVPHFLQDPQRIYSTSHNQVPWRQVRWLQTLLKWIHRRTDRKCSNNSCHTNEYIRQISYGITLHEYTCLLYLSVILKTYDSPHYTDAPLFNTIILLQNL